MVMWQLVVPIETMWTVWLYQCELAGPHVAKPRRLLSGIPKYMSTKMGVDCKSFGTVLHMIILNGKVGYVKDMKID